MCRLVRETSHGGALRATANRASLRSLAAPRSSNDASPPIGSALQRHRRTLALKRHASAQTSFRPPSKPPPSATARKSCGCQTSTPTLCRIEKSLAVSRDMRMLGREREINGVINLSHLCPFGALEFRLRTITYDVLTIKKRPSSRRNRSFGSACRVMNMNITPSRMRFPW